MDLSDLELWENLCAKNLIKAGHDLIVTTHNPDTLKEMEALGAKAVHNGKEVAEEAEVIITMLPNSPQVREVALGKRNY